MWAARATLQVESDQEPPGPDSPSADRVPSVQIWARAPVPPPAALKSPLSSDTFAYFLCCCWNTFLCHRVMISAILFLPTLPPLGRNLLWNHLDGVFLRVAAKVRPSRLPHVGLCDEGAWMPINIQVCFYFTYGGNECRPFLSPLKAS